MKTNKELDLEFNKELKRISQQFNKSLILPIILIVLSIILIVLWLFGVFVAFGGLKIYGF